MKKTLAIIRHDPWLEPYSDAINGRHDEAVRKEKELAGKGGTLVDFANAHKYFGLHKTRSGWAFREWAPNATQIFMVGTFNGWKEDFDLGVLGSIPSHNDAMKYVKESMNHFQGKGFIFGGHSKGGNLASYVALNLPKSLREERFIKAYIIDGPGFRKDILLKGEFESIQDKVVSLAPNQSVVGMILYSPFPVQPVDSKGLIVFQHDVYLWKIQWTDFVRGNFDPISYTVKRWTISIFEDMQVDEIKMTLDVIFDFLQGLYGDTVSDIFAHPWRSLFFFVGGMKGIDESAKTILKKSGKIQNIFYLRKTLEIVHQKR